jgi:thiamine biosynthesis lipoprotein
MGTDVHLCVVGGDRALRDVGLARIRELEARWSRFLDSSEISALNRSPGRPVVVSPETAELVARSVLAWQGTGGRFDPTVGPALAAHGYDRTFEEVRSRTCAAPTDVDPAPGPGGVEVLPGTNVVILPPGVTLDPGGIGKGLAADLTAELLVHAGAEGALVNLGGDLRAIGRAPTEEGWAITVDHPIDPDRELLRLALPGGAVATSSRLLRRWTTSAGEVHHLIDPGTGAPAVTEVVAVTAVAGEAWWAEALTKALFLAGPQALTDGGDLHAVVVTADGACHATADLERTLR